MNEVTATTTAAVLEARARRGVRPAAGDPRHRHRRPTGRGGRGLLRGVTAHGRRQVTSLRGDRRRWHIRPSRWTCSRSWSDCSPSAAGCSSSGWRATDAHPGPGPEPQAPVLLADEPTHGCGPVERQSPDRPGRRRPGTATVVARRQHAAGSRARRCCSTSCPHRGRIERAIRPARHRPPRRDRGPLPRLPPRVGGIPISTSPPLDHLVDVAVPVGPETGRGRRCGRAIAVAGGRRRRRSPLRPPRRSPSFRSTQLERVEPG